MNTCCTRVVFGILLVQASVTAGAIAPNLSIRSLGETNFVLSWPNTGQPFVLESSPTLAPPIFWQPVFPSAALSNDTYSLVLANTRLNRFFRLRAETVLPAATFHIESISPVHGEEMVNTTRKTIVRFDGVVDPATLTTNSLYLIANGERVSGSIDVSSTERYASFVPGAPVPPSTSVRLVVNGNLIRARDGSLLDADGDNFPGGIRIADFQTLPLTRIAGTRFSGFVRDAYSLRPIAGATMRVDAFPAANSVTDSNGHFDLIDMPAPEFFVHVDGTTAINPPAGFTYPSVGKTFHTIPGQVVDFFVVHLPPMANGDFRTLSSVTNTVVGFGSGGLAELDQMFPTINPATWQRMKVTYPPGSAVDDFGNPATQAIIVPVPPDRLPSPLPTFANPKLVISIQAPGATTFDVPAPVTFPNLDGLAPSQKSLIYSFNHDAGRWEVIGSATVSADGLTLVSDPGVGIRAPGWHFTSPLAQGKGGNSSSGGAGAVLGTSPGCSPQVLSVPPLPPPPQLNGIAIAISSPGPTAYSSGGAVSFAVAPGPGRSGNPAAPLSLCPVTGNSGTAPPGNGGVVVLSVPPMNPVPPAGNVAPVLIARQTVQNGLAGMDFGTKDYLFTNDTDFFYLFFKNDAPHPMSGQTATLLVVDISFDGAAGEILDGAVGQTFSLDTQQSKTLKIDSRDLAALVSPVRSPLNFVEVDRLYAARCRVTAHAAGSTQLLIDQEIRVMRFLDAADADHGDGIIDMFGAGERQTTRRPIEYHFGGLSIQNPLAMVDRVNFDFNEPTSEFEFHPQPVPYDHSSYGITGKVFVYSKRLIGSSPVKAGELTLRGDCKLVTFYIDDQAFRDTMLRMSLFTTEVRPGDPQPLPISLGGFDEVLLERTPLSTNAVASTKANLSSPSVQSSLLNLVSGYLRDYLAPLNQGSLNVVQVFDRASADIVIDVFHSKLTRLTCTEVEYIFGRHGLSGSCDPTNLGAAHILGLSLGLPFVPADNFPGEWFLQADHIQPTSSAPGSPGTVEFASIFRSDYNRNEQNFRLSKALNGSEKGALDLFLEKFLTVPLSSEPDDLMHRADSIAQYLAHLLGHQIGLVDTRYARFYPPGVSVELPVADAHFDLMNECGQGFRFMASLDMARIALGLDSDQATFDRVFHLLQEYRAAYGDFDGLPMLANPLAAGCVNPPALATAFSVKNAVGARSVAATAATQAGSLAVIGPQDRFFVERVDFGSALMPRPGGAITTTNLLLANLGRGNVVLSDINLQTAADFRLSPSVTRGTVLGPGATLAFSITFDPASSGEHLAILTIENDGTPSRVAVPIRGFAQSSFGDIRVTVPTNNNFGGVGLADPPRALERFAVISNVGLSTLRLSEVSVSRGSNEFSLSGLPAGFGPANPIVLSPGASLAFDLTFRPTAAGLRPGEVRIVSDDADSPILTFPVVGTGLTNTSPSAQWGDDFVLLETPNSMTRLRSAADGSFYFYLPPNEPYALHIFDPETGLVAVSSGVTESNNMPTLFSPPVFAASVAPDADRDGLPDDIGFIIGPGSLFDFGTADSPVSAGYARVTPETFYDSTRGYGWALTSRQTVTSADRQTTTALSALKRDFDETRDATFFVDLTNGLYEITVTLGDAATAHEQMAVFLEDELRGNVSTMAGEFITTTYRVAVADGQLTLALKAQAATTVAINALEITPVSVGASGSAVSNIAGRIFYALQDLETGFISRNTVDLLSGETLFAGGLSLAPNTRYRLSLLRADDLQISVVDFATPPAGNTFDLPAVVFGPATGPDSDSDGIDDLGEFAIGTNPNDRDTDHDGLSDLAEIQQRLDPLDNRGLPTGIIGAVALKGEANEVVVEASPLEPNKRIAYVATGPHGLALVDVSQIRNPIVLGQLDLTGYAWDVSVDPALQLAVVAADQDGLHIVDVSDPMLPRLVRTIGTNAVQIEVVNGKIYAALDQTLAVFDLQSGAPIEELILSTSTIRALAREGLMLYALDDGWTLHAIDLSGLAMIRRGSLTLPREGAKIFAGNGIVYVAARNSGGFLTVDVSNPANLRLISDTDALPGTSQAIAIAHNGSGIALVTNPGLPQALQVFNASNPSNTFSILASFLLPFNFEPRGVGIASGAGFVADASAGLQVVNYLSVDAAGRAPTIALSTSANDEDSASAGLQIVEGKTISVIARINDDVQVQSAAFFVNGQLVRTDLSFPFDCTVTLPFLAAGASNVAIQVRASDTGGNSTLSTPLLITVVPDKFPPHLVSITPTNGAVVSQRFQTIKLIFSEPMNTNTLRPENIRLTRASSPQSSVAPTNTQIGSFGQAVEFTFSALAPSGSQLHLAASNITDAAGNALGAAEIVSTFTVRSNVVFWANAAGGFWDDPSNWFGGELPSPDDNVIINVPADVTIVHRTGTNRIYSLTSANKFTLSGGTLDVATTIQINNTFTLERGLSDTPRLSHARLLPSTNSAGVLVAPNALIIFDGVILDKDMTIDGGSTVTVLNGLTLNATLRLGSPTNGPASMAFDGSQVLRGTGLVQFSAGFLGGGSLEGYESLTIGSGITIRGKGSVFAYTNLVNQGTIVAEMMPGEQFFGLTLSGSFSNQGAIFVGGDGFASLQNIVNTGRIVATNSALELRGAWTNQGILAATNSTVYFNGTYTLASFGTFVRSGGRVELTGVFDNRGTTLTLDAATGSWEISARVIGGRLNTIGNAEFNPVTGYFDGVTLDGNARVAGPGNDILYLTNGFTLNGKLTVDARVIFQDSQPLSGNGEVMLTGSLFGLRANIPVTIGPGVTVRGNGIGASVGSATLPGIIVNQGRIVAEGTNRTTTVAATNFTNTGRLENSSGGRLFINAPLVNSGQLNPGGIAAVGFITINSNFVQTATGVLNIDIGGASTNQFDRLFVNRGATFGGTLNLNLINGFVPSSTNRFPIVTFPSRTNDFATKNGLTQGGLTFVPQFSATNLTLIVQP